MKTAKFAPRSALTSLTSRIKLALNRIQKKTKAGSVKPAKKPNSRKKSPALKTGRSGIVARVAKAKFRPVGKKPAKAKTVTAKKTKPLDAKSRKLARKAALALEAAAAADTAQKQKKKALAQVARELSKELQDILSRAQTRHWLIELGGENAIEVVKSLPYVPNDEELAKKLKIKVSDVRASLNKLHNDGLVTYIRDKNSETGWYSYTWVINEEKIKKWVGERYAKEQAFAPQDGTAFYFCKDCGLESAVSFVVASDCAFKCQDCNSPLDFLDAEKFEQLRKSREMEK